jgi:hypothetical protein
MNKTMAGVFQNVKTTMKISAKKGQTRRGSGWKEEGY